MKRILHTTTIASTLGFAISFLLYTLIENSFFLTLTITLATVSYHLLMRLAVGFSFDLIMKNHADYRSFPFKAYRFEEKLYKVLRVKRWSKNISSYEPELFSTAIHTWSEIAEASCQAEAVHVTIVFLSFIPLAFSCLFGDFWIFFITSFLAAAFDMRFVIAQRYNRPRIIRIIDREEKKKKV